MKKRIMIKIIITTVIGWIISASGFALLLFKGFENQEDYLVFFSFVLLFSIGRAISVSGVKSIKRKQNINMRLNERKKAFIYLLLLIYVSFFVGKSNALNISFIQDINYFVENNILISSLIISFVFITDVGKFMFVRYFYIKNFFCKDCKIEYRPIAYMKVQAPIFKTSGGGYTKVGEAVSRQSNESYNIYKYDSGDLEVVGTKILVGERCKCNKCGKEIDYIYDGAKKISWPIYDPKSTSYSSFQFGNFNMDNHHILLDYFPINNNDKDFKKKTFKKILKQK